MRQADSLVAEKTPSLGRGKHSEMGAPKMLEGVGVLVDRPKQVVFEIWYKNKSGMIETVIVRADTLKEAIEMAETAMRGQVFLGMVRRG